MRPDYQEISEEFRHFHRLYHEQRDNKFYKIDDGGTEHLVAIIEPDRIQIRVKEIRQFLAIKEMHLAIFFDYVEYSRLGLDEFELAERINERNGDSECWCLSYGDSHGMCGFHAFSRLCGKRFIAPVPKEKSGMWGFAEKEQDQYADFIIGSDDNGDGIIHTSDPAKLANNFGANKGAPNYLTAVHFRKSVLDKYYNLPGKFSVEDSYLRCGSLWGLQMDNHHGDKVCAWLGDLGRDLPYEEQLHWRSHNIEPVGEVSDVYFKRQIMAVATDSEQPEHIFKSEYSDLLRTSSSALGWRILLPLTEGDKHHLKSLRIPASDEQCDFDGLTLALTKILVDSLNEKQLNKFIPNEDRGVIKGSISRLEKALDECGVTGYQEHVGFLRKLQNLRSTGVAHRKGSKYEKIAEEFGIENKNLSAVFEEILVKAAAVLRFLKETISMGDLSHG